MPAHGTIHVNAWSRSKLYDDNNRHPDRRKSLATTHVVNSSEKRHSIQVQHVARKSNASNDHQKIQKRKKTKKPKWIIRKYLTENQVGSSDHQSSESPEKTEEFSAQTFNRIEFESLSTFYPKKDGSQHRLSRFGQIEDLKTEKKRKRRNLAARPCCILCSIIFITLLLAGLAALLVGLLIKNSSTTTTTSTIATTTLTRPNSSCSSTGRGTLFNLTGLTSLSWTQYHFNYTAVNSSHTISFGIQSENNRGYYLDEISIVATNDTTTELLINGDFDNSTVSLFGWTQSCTNSCGGYDGVISTSSNCFNGNCYFDRCRASLFGIDFLEQTFTTIIGQIYTISFMILLTGSGTAADNTVLVDVF